MYIARHSSKALVPRRDGSIDVKGGVKSVESKRFGGFVNLKKASKRIYQSPESDSAGVVEWTG